MMDDWNFGGMVMGKHNVTAEEAVKWFEDWGLTPEIANQVLSNYSSFLCAMTGGKLSKIGYDLETMETCARDYWDMKYHLFDA